MRSPLLVSLILLTWPGEGQAAQFRAAVHPAMPSAFTGIPIAPALSAAGRAVPSFSLSLAPSLSVLPAAPLAQPAIPFLPAAFSPGPDMGAAVSPVALPYAAPATLPSASPAFLPTAPKTTVPAGLLEAAVRFAVPQTPADSQGAGLGALFDGSVPILGGSGLAAPGVSGADVPPPLRTGSGLAFDARTFSNAYGLYSWLSGIPEVAAAADPDLAKARMLLALRGLLDKGPVIVTKDASGLTALAADDPSVPPVVISLAAGDLASTEATPQAAALAGYLKNARARDEADPGRFYTAEVLSKLAAIADQAPAPEKASPKLERVEDIPIDPVLQPHEHLGRMLRDAARAQTPEESLAILKDAKLQAKKLLNSSERNRFLGRLLSHGELLARQSIPGLLERMQLSAADSDRAGVDAIVDTAMGFVEYAPAWKARVLQARETAMNTLAVLERFGPMDEKTGLPVPPAQTTEPAEAVSGP